MPSLTVTDLVHLNQGADLLFNKLCGYAKVGTPEWTWLQAECKRRTKRIEKITRIANKYLIGPESGRMV